MNSQNICKHLKTKLGLIAIGTLLLTTNSQAMIKNSLVVHNSRNETITVEVSNSQGESLGAFSINTHAVRSIKIEDTQEGTDWFDAYDASGRWIKQGSASGVYSNFDWWVD